MPSLDQLKDKDKFNGSDDPDSIPFATYLGLVTARCVQQDIGHVLVDTDPNQRTHRLVNVMEDDPEGEIDPATGSVRRVVKLSAESVAQYAALKKSWADDDAKVKSILTLTTIGEAN